MLYASKVLKNREKAEIELPKIVHKKPNGKYPNERIQNNKKK